MLWDVESLHNFTSHKDSEDCKRERGKPKVKQALFSQDFIYYFLFFPLFFLSISTNRKVYQIPQFLMISDQQLATHHLILKLIPCKNT